MPPSTPATWWAASTSATSRPSQCRYDPTHGRSRAVHGQRRHRTSRQTASAPRRPLAMNKIWYGQTSNGSVPSPSADNGFATSPATAANQRWYGLTRGTSLGGAHGGADALHHRHRHGGAGTAEPDAGRRLPSSTRPATAPTAGRPCRTRTSSQRLRPRRAAAAAFANINTDDPNIDRFAARGGKMLVYHGLADTLIPPQGTVNYYNRAACARWAAMTVVQQLLPAFPGPRHGARLRQRHHQPGREPAAADQRPALPGADAVGGKRQLARAHRHLGAGTPALSPASSRPICLYPTKATLTGGDPRLAARTSAPE